ncbi:YihY/virulence factor BrkB family protein [Opitutus terrae]|uniref:Ribonuclease BN n=1 Tax=Opitutus terrae (strain DSM 11246 / JCM 15787 / PB90-1) TaxID=452637 RepID=B1ZTW4_OPITP|nr:YihY/virulence factor BrkB family protein [Opitutus terrae]ACB75846.1 ribonuclease BN [Opitutus terrae PB90-1]
MFRLADRWRRFLALYRKEIWQPGQLQERTPRGMLYALLRIVSITWTVFCETKAASRAAALSFSSLLGLGPLVALTVLIAGFALNKDDPNLAANALSRLINFVAPQVGQYSRLDEERASRPAGSARVSPAPVEAAGETPAHPGSASAAPTAAPTAPAPPRLEARPFPDVRLNPRLVQMMNNFINQGRSGSAGTVGFFGLVIIVLLLFKTVEDTFNEIWGVRSGRGVLMRIVYYWTTLTLGAVLFFASVTLLSAGAFFSVFNNALADLPFSAQMAAMLQWSLPALSFTLVALLLTIFYRVIPHTRVFWRSAFTGAIVVAALLMLNHYLAFLYVRRVILTESLYGSLGLPLVMMFGLYIFWLYVLIGGQISYAVQNVHFRNSQAAWGNLSQSMRERLLLVVLLTICRRFRDCRPPMTTSELGEMIKVPTQILNECLNRLADLQLVTAVPPRTPDDPTDLRYQPARPLNRITLRDFKRLDDDFGDNPMVGALEHIDPVVAHYRQAVTHTTESDFFSKSLEDLLAEHPFDAPRLPDGAGAPPAANG